MNLGQRSFGPVSLRLAHFRPEGLPPDLYAAVRYVSHVETDAAHRGKGHATRALRKIAAEADAEGISLIIAPEPFADSPMDRNALESWYTRSGWERFQDEPCLMVRVARQ